MPKQSHKEQILPILLGFAILSSEAIVWIFNPGFVKFTELVGYQEVPHLPGSLQRAYIFILFHETITERAIIINQSNFKFGYLHSNDRVI